jgi:AcrR family transcriptional regulator
MDQKEKILTVAKALFLQYGIKSVSMDDIARELGISKKTLYTVVGSKDILVKEVVKDHVKEESQIIHKIEIESKNALEIIFKITDHVNTFMRGMKPSITYDLKKYHRESWRIIEEEHHTFIEKTIKLNIERGIKEGLYRENIDPFVISKLYIANMELLTNEEIFSLKEHSMIALYAQKILYHLHGIVNNKGLKQLTSLENKYVINGK